MTRATGILLLLLGVLHLVATPFFIEWSSTALRPGQAALVIAGMRLNHILVGILLLPLGISTYWTAAALRESWALRLAVLNALTLLCLPILLLTTMPLRALNAPLFRLAILVLTLACVAEMLALVGAWSQRRKRADSGAR
jgi:signal transduction histidine kinase